MRFLLDAGLSYRLIDLFAEYGHDAIHHDALLPGRSKDEAVAAAATAAGRCLVTRDFDFSDTREFPPRNFNGIVVFTIPRMPGPGYITMLVREFLTRLPEFSGLSGKLLIVEPGRIRVRE